MKKNSVWKIIISSFLLLWVLAVIVSFPIVKSGYEMYTEAMKKTSLENAINQVRKDDNYILIKDISPDFLKMVLASEDQRFYWHFGIDLIATSRAMLNNVKAKAFVQGGSTITQQLAKNLYFSFEKRFERKVAELFVAFQLEKMLTKNEILELYCNVVYFGEGCYGLQEATEHYYYVEPSKITIEQAAILVKTLKSPNYYNPNAIKL